MTGTRRPELCAPCAGHRDNATGASAGDDALDCTDYADIAGAAAQVAAHSDPNLAFQGGLRPQDEIARGDQHAGSAIAALQSVLARESDAQLFADLIVVEPLDGDDIRAAARHRIGDT
jgi:hypothetical protein